MGTKTNLDWLNNNSLLDGGTIGFQNIQGPVISEHLPVNNATQPNYITNTSTNNNNSINTNQVLGTVSGGAQMLNSWFGNLDKPIEDATTSNNTVNGYGYTSINKINQPSMGSGAFGSTLSGAASGASAGAALGPLGAGIGAGIGAIGGFVSNLFGNKRRAQQIDKQNTINTEKTGYNRSQANTNYLKQQYTQNSTFADGGMYLSTMITDMMSKMRNHDINNHNLNNFFTGGMFKGTQLDPESLTDRLIRNKYVDGGEYNPGMTGMMKAKMALAAAFENKSAKRMTSLNPQTYTFTGKEGTDEPVGEKGTHYMGSYDNIARPSIQEINGKLQFTGFPSNRSNEDIIFDRPEDADYFAEHYKEIAPMMKKLG